MRRRPTLSCTYVVTLDSDAGRSDVQALAHYLSTINHECDVVVVDAAGATVFADRERVLRWVARHVAVRAHHRFADGSIDIVHAASDFCGTEKVIVATCESRYSAAEVHALCEMLDRFEVVEPEEYVDPLPWWGGVDAGRLLLHRGIEQIPESGSTFAFRRSAYRPMRASDDRGTGGPVKRLVMQGAEVHEAHGVFVRRVPRHFNAWLRLRPHEAAADLVAPAKSAFFLAAVPILIVLAILGGLQVAAGYAGVMACGSVLLALRGRAGAGKFFPLHACLFAPLWIVERSISVYWALFDRLRAAKTGTDSGRSTRGGRTSGATAING